MLTKQKLITKASPNEFTQVKHRKNVSNMRKKIAVISVIIYVY